MAGSAGFAAVPAAMFWAGCAGWDAGHGVYLLLLMGPLLARTLRLQPLVNVLRPHPHPLPNNNAGKVRLRTKGAPDPQLI